MTERPSLNVVGTAVPIADAVAKVAGILRFGVDVAVPDMVHGKILRSPHAHAAITRIDTTRAEALPGVLGVVTHRDAPTGPWKNCWHNHEGRILDDVVRFVGDEIAAVAAVSPDIAAEALKLIEVDYEPLPAVFEPLDALTAESPQVRPEGNARPPMEVEWGDFEGAEAAADCIVEADMSFDGQAHAPIGRNACIADWEGDRVTVWTSTQTPSEMREAIAAVIGIPLADVRVIAHPTGSSFGLWWIGAMQMITVLLARKTGRPVRIELDPEECFAGVKRRHRERSRGRLGVNRDGTVTFIDVSHVHDNGGYGMKPDVGFLVVDTWGACSAGRYAIQGVSTNNLTAGCMRGVGDVTLGAFVERLLDLAAIEIDEDPLSFRLRNHLRVGEPLRAAGKRDEAPQPPAHLPEGWPEPGLLSSEALGECLVRGAEAFGWEQRWAGWGTPTSVDGPRRRGVGVATGVHCCGTEDEYPASALVRMHSDGSVSLACSMGRQGQGSETTQAQIVAEVLALPVDRIRVEAGDTDICPPNHGSIASNTAFRTGFATHDAAVDARRQLVDAAAQHLGVDPGGLIVENGAVRSVTDPALSMSFTEVLTTHLPDSFSFPTVVGRTTSPMPPGFTYARNFAAHFVEVEVDMETGAIRLIDLVATQDSGTVLNPKVLENQVIGGAIMGSGYALSEGLAHDPDTGRILNPGFLDYKVMRAPDFPIDPTVIFCESYDPVGPFGAKSAGEAPACAPIPAIAQAVYNAAGVWLDVPMTPERFLVALGTLPPTVP